MRGAPQGGSPGHIRRIRSRVSRTSAGRRVVRVGASKSKSGETADHASYDGFGFHQDKVERQSRSGRDKRDPEEAIGGGQFRSFPEQALKYADLLVLG
jgi:hypothetical protein